VFVANVPKYVSYYHLTERFNSVFIFSDFVITGLGFLAIGFSLYISAKIVGGRGTLGASVTAGLYLSAPWSFFLLSEYVYISGVSSSTLCVSGPADEPITWHDGFLIIVSLAIALYVLRATVPCQSTFIRLELSEQLLRAFSGWSSI